MLVFLAARFRASMPRVLVLDEGFHLQSWRGFFVRIRTQDKRGFI
jgi:hypothetical protein